MTTKGYVVRMRPPWDEIGPHFVAAESAARAKTIVVRSGRESFPTITYADVRSCVRCPQLDGLSRGYHGEPK